VIGSFSGGGLEKKIIVDIDNTLWEFAPVLYECLKEVSPSILPMDLWGGWKFWEKDMDTRTFYRVLKDIHMRQEEFAPYADARQFLLSLRERRFRILIASHREEEAYGPTMKWLRKYELVFDELHILNDKSILFEGVFGIVDDSPETLTKAAKAGIVATGLIFPWNEGLGYSLFRTLPEVLAYIDSELARQGDGSGRGTSNEPTQS
jgi:hypothetical protein